MRWPWQAAMRRSEAVICDLLAELADRGQAQEGSQEKKRVQQVSSLRRRRRCI